MNYYAKLTTKTNETPKLLVFDRPSYRDEAIRLASFVGATVVDVYASDVPKADKNNALPVATWYRFVHEYDFGYPVGKCDDCQATTHQTDDGECVICKERDYQLNIWVKPRNIADAKEFLNTDKDCRYKLHWKMVRPKFVYLSHTDTEEGVAELLALMEQTREKQLTENVHAVVNHDIMENGHIVLLLMRHSLETLNINEVRWFYVAPAGHLNYMNIKTPPHWKV